MIIDYHRRLHNINLFRSLEDTIKFDRMATEGLKKKFNLIEYDVKEFQHSNEMMRYLFIHTGMLFVDTNVIIRIISIRF